MASSAHTSQEPCISTGAEFWPVCLDPCSFGCIAVHARARPSSQTPRCLRWPNQRCCVPLSCEALGSAGLPEQRHCRWAQLGTLRADAATGRYQPQPRDRVRWTTMLSDCALRGLSGSES